MNGTFQVIGHRDCLLDSVHCQRKSALGRLDSRPIRFGFTLSRIVIDEAAIPPYCIPPRLGATARIKPERARKPEKLGNPYEYMDRSTQGFAPDQTPASKIVARKPENDDQSQASETETRIQRAAAVEGSQTTPRRINR